MSLFGQIVRTVINVATLPVAVVKDVATLGGNLTEQDESYTEQHLDKLKEEAED